MRRFHRAKDKQEVIDKLFANGKGPFSQIWQIIVFATCLGYKMGRKEPLGDCDSSVAIPPSVFLNNCASWPGLGYMINLVESKDPHILNMDDSTDEKRITLLEEYANAGLAKMREELEVKDYSLDGIIQMIHKYLDHNKSETDSI
jgi:dnd system-associated protein 4